MNEKPKIPLTLMEQFWLWIILKEIGKMNKDQLQSLARMVLMFAGSFMVTKGYLTANQVAGLTTLLPQIFGPILVAGPAIWGLFVHTKAQMVVRAADIVPISVTDQVKAGVPIENTVAVPTNPKT